MAKQETSQERQQAARPRWQRARPLTAPGGAGGWDDAHRFAMLRRFGGWFVRESARTGLSTLELARRAAKATGGAPLISSTTLWRYRALATWTTESTKPQHINELDLLKIAWLCLDMQAFDTSLTALLAEVLGAWRDLTPATREMADARLRAEVLADRFTRLTPARQRALWDYTRFLITEQAGADLLADGLDHAPDAARLRALAEQEDAHSLAERIALAEESERLYADLHRTHERQRADEDEPLVAVNDHPRPSPATPATKTRRHARKTAGRD